jgi:hypothetical protein
MDASPDTGPVGSVFARRSSAIIARFAGAGKAIVRRFSLAGRSGEP